MVPVSTLMSSIEIATRQRRDKQPRKSISKKPATRISRDIEAYRGVKSRNVFQLQKYQILRIEKEDPAAKDRLAGLDHWGQTAIHEVIEARAAASTGQVRVSALTRRPSPCFCGQRAAS